MKIPTLTFHGAKAHDGAEKPSDGLTRILNSAVIWPLLHARHELDLRLLQTLARRGRCWIAAVLVANVTMMVAVYFSGAADARAPFNGAVPFEMTMPLWSSGIWLLAALGYFLHRATIRLSTESSKQEARRLKFAWFFFAVLFSAWWSMGMFALRNPPPSQSFVLGQRTFIWLTALGHVATLVMLSSNWEILLGTLAVGFFLPAVEAMVLAEQGRPTGSRTFLSIYWLSGQIATYFFVSLFLHFDQRKLLVKQISLENERRRADELLRQKDLDQEKLLAKQSSLEEARRQTDELLRQKDLDQKKLLAKQSSLEEARRRTDDLLRQKDLDQKKLLTKQTLLKNERRRANDLLRQKELDEKKLLTKQTLLENERRRANDLLYQKNNLLASFSHDLRQPMTALAFGLDGLKDKLSEGLSNTDVQKAISIAEGQVAAMANMVNTALDLARVEAGQYPIERREIDIRSVLEQVLGDLRGEAAKKGIKLSMFTPPYIGVSDRDALIRIVRNLVSNAVKYTQPTCGRKAHILLGCQRRGTELRISVFDTGIGIRAEDQESIFKEYVQLANPERDRRKGLGLGLSIVAALSKLLQHPLEVASVPDVGSRFSIRLPYVGRMPVNPEITDEVRLDTPDLSGMVVMVLEDDLDVREVMSDRLSSWGCYVIAGESLEELQTYLGDIANAHSPHLLLADYRLQHRKTGIEAVHSLRVLYPNLPAVIVSGEVTSAVLKEVADADLPFLSKPITRNQMIELLLRHRPFQQTLTDVNHC